MNILLTGATGYIGKRLLPLLVKEGHKVYCVVRDLNRFEVSEGMKPHINVIQADLLDDTFLEEFNDRIDVAYYLVHSMSSHKDYHDMESKSAIIFKKAMDRLQVQQVIYLSGIVNEEKLSRHLGSRRNVEEILAQGNYAFTALRAGIIIGSGSASFEIIRDLVEKLPFMITPKWLNIKCQPIAIRDVLKYLLRSAANEQTYNKIYDIGGEDILTYKEMLLGFAKSRDLKRWIWTVPVMTPKLSSYWLYFVTSTSYSLATALVDSMKIEVICKKGNIREVIPFETLSYQKALENAHAKISNGEIISSWKDSFISGNLAMKLEDFIKVPTYGCFKDTTIYTVSDRERSKERVWRIGGVNGWYYGQWLWSIRGYLDKLFGGVGLRRGRRHPYLIKEGDSIDFWRVLYANREEGRLLLFAEMKLPGEAWLEFDVKKDTFKLEATFRPKGLLGRLYWYSVQPFHGFIFKGLARKIAS